MQLQGLLPRTNIHSLWRTGGAELTGHFNRLDLESPRRRFCAASTVCGAFAEVHPRNVVELCDTPGQWPPVAKEIAGESRSLARTVLHLPA